MSTEKQTPAGGRVRKDSAPGSDRSGPALTDADRPRGSELNPVTIERAEWGQPERELAAAVRDSLAAPSPLNRDAVLHGLR